MTNSHVICACHAIVPLVRLMHPHVQPDDVEPLVGGECPRCGSTRYVPLRLVSIEELARLPLVMTSGGVAA